MTDQRARLQADLAEIRSEIESLRGARPGTYEFAHLNQLRTHREQTEMAFAQLELADAYQRASASQQRLAEAENRRAKASEDDRASRDDASFWSRRFYTSLAVGNGVGFVTISTAIIQSGKMGWAVVLGFAPLGYFAVGLTAASMIPWLVWRSRAAKEAGKLRPVFDRVVLAMATVSSGAFLLGVGAAAVEAWQMNAVAARVAIVEMRAEAAQTEAALRVPPAKPSAPPRQAKP
jgi:Flp pilus assembly protein TadB